MSSQEDFQIFMSDPDEESSRNSEKRAILVIDDDQSIRESLRLAFQDHLDVETCSSGDLAVKLFHPRIHAVILDIRMEGMDGFETYQELKKKNKEVPIIFYSAYQDLKDPYEIMNLYRPFGYVMKGTDFRFLKDSVSSALDYYASIRENRELVQKLRDINNNLEEIVQNRTRTIQEQTTILEEQLDMARKIQESLLPSSVPVIENTSLAFRYVPAQKISGDFLDIFHKKDSADIGLFICDVSGHGVPAAFLSAMIKMSLQEWETHLFEPDSLLRRIHSIMGNKMGNNFATAMAAYLNSETGLFLYSSAGHPPPILIRNGKGRFLPREGAAICDIFQANQKLMEIQLFPGDRVVLYTDGISEIHNENDEYLSDEEFLNFILTDSTLSLEEHCHSSLERARELEASSFQDDISLLMLDFRP